MGMAMFGGDLLSSDVQASESCGEPGAKDYCASSVCGPCAEGEGDCDPGQCAAGLECVEEGSIDHCRAEASCGTLDAKDYCASSVCGPCAEGEGDCDPGQCAAGLECVEEGWIDHCWAEASCGTLDAKDYCASSVCGPCAEGEGDCDPGQCAAGLECVEEGWVDHCWAEASCGTLGARDYCASSVCGPCAEGEGDCDPGQCAAGLGCVEEGSIDHCRTVETGSLEVQDDGVWKAVCCNGGTPELSAGDCEWSVSDRFLTDEGHGVKLDCLEGDPSDCVCNSTGETLHGADYSIFLPGGGPLFPNYLEETCVVVKPDGRLATDWTDSACPDFRLD